MFVLEANDQIVSAEGIMGRKNGAWRREVDARDHVIRTAIGRMLSAQYDLTEPLPDRLEFLLKRFERAEVARAVEIRPK